VRDEAEYEKEYEEGYDEDRFNGLIESQQTQCQNLERKERGRR